VRRSAAHSGRFDERVGKDMCCTYAYRFQRTRHACVSTAVKGEGKVEGEGEEEGEGEGVGEGVGEEERARERER